MTSKPLNLTVCGVTFDSIETENVQGGTSFEITTADGSHMVYGWIGSKMWLTVNNYEPTTGNRSAAFVNIGGSPRCTIVGDDNYLIDMFYYFLTNIRTLIKKM